MPVKHNPGMRDEGGPRGFAEHVERATSLASAGRDADARDTLRTAVAQWPQEAGLWWRLALAESALGDAAAALACLARALECGPKSAEDWRRIGWSYLEYWKFPEAEAALSRAAAMAPGDAGVETLLATAKHQSGDTDGALQALARARAANGTSLQLDVAASLLLPQVYESAGDVARWRGRYTAGLTHLEAELPRWRGDAAAVFELAHENFLLAYQGEDDRELQRRYSALLAGLAGRARPQWRAPRPSTFDGSRRLRVGFVGSIFRDCTAGRYFERWITGLDPARFERIVYHTAPLSDDFTRGIAAASEHFVPVRASTEALAARLADDRLDAIVHPEVGMTPASYLLAALRLAPVQLAGWGHPVTTGSDAIDYYFTAGAMEPGDGDRHYVEKLQRLPGLGVEYAMPAVEPAFQRAELGLPAGKRIYLCAQSLFKIHPEMDALFAEILARDPDGILVFFQGLARGVTERFGRRLQAALAAHGVPPRSQVKFLPRLPGTAFRRVVAAADVVLDTVRWSGGNTTLDTLAAGTPPVGIEGRLMRARQTSTMLRALDLGELVAPSPEGYAALAVEVARDAGRNAYLRREIVRRREALFGQRAATQAFADALLRLAARS